MFQNLVNLSKKLIGDPSKLDETVERLRSQSQLPALWLLGKTQSGKSSIVRTLTGRTDIEIGNGFKPQTRLSSLYDFPSTDTPLIRFLDTRGIGEVDYDPTEDIAACGPLTHVLVIVIKITDHAVEELIEIVKSIKKRHPQIPTLLVLTCLHETYEDGQEHPSVYPFDTTNLECSETCPKALRMHIEEHRRVFSRTFDAMVLIDFTFEEDDYQPADYGRPALLQTLHRLLPQAIWNMLLRHEEASVAQDFLTTAHPYIVFYSILAGSGAAVPLPLVDLPVVAATQLKMLHSLAAIYNQKLTYMRLAEIVATLGFSYTWRMGLRSLSKFLPGGNLAYASVTAASTYALGYAMCSYFRYIQQGLTPDPEELRKIFKDQLDESREVFEVEGQDTNKSP
jgi:uncharacterized protein (DUF697 family)